VEGLYPRINREPNNYNHSSLASTSLSEKVYPQGFKSSSNLNTSNRESDTRNSASSASSELSSYTNQGYSLPSVEEVNSNFEEKLWDAKNLQNDMEASVKESEDNEIGFHDRRKCIHDRFMGTNLKLKGPESPSTSVDSSTHRVDRILDEVDVGDEICWEDLVFGERIGLGNANGWSYCVGIDRGFTISELVLHNHVHTCVCVCVCVSMHMHTHVQNQCVI
jgi:hypothetical protein